jgi:hypothetical protein
VREQVHSSIDAVVHVVRGHCGRRQVAEVAEVASADDPARVRVLARGETVLAELERRRGIAS